MISSKTKVLLAMVGAILIPVGLTSLAKADTASKTINYTSTTQNIITAHRIAGADRYSTSNALSKKFVSADTVIIASGDNFPDALCAAPLARKNNAPILLSSSNGLSSSTITEITRLKAKKAIIIGGRSSVTSSVETQLASQGITYTRLEGKDRYETSLLVAKQLDKPTAVVVASGEDFPDALSISNIASQLNMPIILSGKDGLSADAQRYIKNSGATKAYIIGGTGALSEKIDAEVPNPVRLAGTDRYATDLKVLNEFSSKLNFDNVYLANGEGFADALSGSPVASNTSSPVVLVSTDIDTNINKYLQEHINLNTKVVALGGTSVVSDSLVGKTMDSKSLVSAAKIYSSSGAFSGDTINGSAIISASGVKLKNTTITGDLLITSTVGEGTIDLDNVTVKGKIIVNGGGRHSIGLHNMDVNEINLDKILGEQARIVTDATSSIASTTIESNGIVDQSLTSKAGKIVVKEGALATLSGSFDTVEIAGSGANVDVKEAKISILSVKPEALNASINTSSNTSITTLNLNAAANVLGNAAITTANIGISGATIEAKPTTLALVKGVTATVAGSSRNLNDGNSKEIAAVPTTSTSTNIYSSSTSSGGGSSRSSNSIYYTTEVTISSPSTAVEIGNTINFTAIVAPTNSTNKNVTWSIVTGGEYATIDPSTGVLTGVSAGTVTVKAVTVDTGISSKTITITVTPKAADESISKAKALIPSSFTAVQGTDTNLIESLSKISGMSETGVTLTLESSNPNVTTDGAITYTDSEVKENVKVKIEKLQGTTDSAIVSVTIPAAYKETDRASLNNVIKNAKTLKKEDYTPKIYEAILNAIRDAETVLNNEKASQTELDNAANLIINVEFRAKLAKEKINSIGDTLLKLPKNKQEVSLIKKKSELLLLIIKAEKDLEDLKAFGVSSEEIEALDNYERINIAKKTLNLIDKTEMIYDQIDYLFGRYGTVTYSDPNNINIKVENNERLGEVFDGHSIIDYVKEKGTNILQPIELKIGDRVIRDVNLFNISCKNDINAAFTSFVNKTKFADVVLNDLRDKSFNATFKIDDENIDYTFNFNVDSITKAMLTDEIKAVKKLNKGKYTDESYKVLEDAIIFAESVLKNSEINQTDIDNAYRGIKAAESSLKEIVPTGKIDKTALGKLVEKAKSVQASDCTPELYLTIHDKIKIAEDLLNSNDVSQSDIDKVSEELSNVLEGAIKAKTDADKIIEALSKLPENKDAAALILDKNNLQPLVDDVNVKIKSARLSGVTDKEIQALNNYERLAIAKYRVKIIEQNDKIIDQAKYVSGIEYVDIHNVDVNYNIDIIIKDGNVLFKDAIKAENMKNYPKDTKQAPIYPKELQVGDITLNSGMVSNPKVKVKIDETFAKLAGKEKFEDITLNDLKGKSFTATFKVVSSSEVIVYTFNFK